METELIYVDFYETAYGTGALLSSEHGIRRLILPHKDREMLGEMVGEKHGWIAHGNRGGSAKLIDGLCRYFSGEAIDFRQLNLSLDLTGSSAFEKEVLAIASYIPYGSIWSYKQLAEKCGRPTAYRAVGNVMGRNRIPVLIPCHRIVKSDLSMGGFGSGSGWKRRLLRLEGITVSPNGKCKLADEP